MNRASLEMADIVHGAGDDFIKRSRRWISWQHQKVLLAITRCRTAALGGHRDQCSSCGHSVISYYSCRNRHCPGCQGNARVRWLEARQRELLPTRYVHVVFTLPRELAALALQNKRLIYNLLFHSSAATLLELARDPRHLGAEIGFFSVLHTWDQRLQPHPHVHCVLPLVDSSPAAPSFSPLKCSAGCSAASSSPDSRAPSIQAHSSSTATSHHSQPRGPLPPGSDSCSATTGSSTPSAPSAGRNTRCVISVPTPPASPSPTTDSLPSPTATSPSAGEIPLTPTTTVP